MMQQFFQVLARFVMKVPGFIVVVALGLATMSGIYAATHITLNADLDDLVSDDLDYHRRYKEFLKEFGDQEYLYVVTDAGGDLPRAKEFVRTLASRLTQLPGLEDVVWQISNPTLEKGFLLYLEPAQLEIMQALTERGPFSIKKISSWDSLAPLFSGLATVMGSDQALEGEAVLSTGFRFVDGLLDGMTMSITHNMPYQSHLQQFLAANDDTFDPDGFLRNGNLLFVLVMPRKDYATMDVIRQPLNAVRGVLTKTRQEFPGITAGLTGRPALNADEMEAANRDSTRATILAVVVIGLLLFLAFRSVSRPCLAVLSLLIGIAWTFGIVALCIGQLTVITSVFALILVGAAIEYAIHVVARYQEELARGCSIEDAVTSSLVHVGSANLTSALTTSAAFLTIVWTDFTALAELGVIAGVGIILCLLSMLIVLPAMLMLRDRRRSASDLRRVHPFVVSWLPKLYRFPRGMMIGIAVVTVIALPFAIKAKFDNNLLHLQAEGLESVRFERLMIEHSTETTWFANVVASTPEDSANKADAFRKLPTVRRVDDVRRIVPPDQDVKQKLIAAMAPAFEHLSFAPLEGTVDRGALLRSLKKLHRRLEPLQSKAFTAGRADAVLELERFSAKMTSVIDLVSHADAQALDRLTSFQNALIADVRHHLEILAQGMHPEPITLDDLPAGLTRRYVSPQGKYAVAIYPKDDIWDPVALERFVTDIRSVDAKVLGTPIEVHESGKLMRATFLRSAVLALIVIIILVGMDVRSWRWTIMAVTPLLLAMVWLGAVMGWVGIPFNMANFFAIPILIGVGIDSGVHLVHRLREDGRLTALGSSTARGMIVNGLCNAVGFGMMMIAAHQGLRSLGEVMAIGAALCPLAALLIVPPLFLWHRSRQSARR
ncbi:MAG: MMPL family transporter [Deltaproteobacteria bacterium]|nr:MMPL family transporter [Deltaproteobacteria bacterium]